MIPLTGRLFYSHFCWNISRNGDRYLGRITGDYKLLILRSFAKRPLVALLAMLKNAAPLACR
jgi:hypothetical protein